MHLFDMSTYFVCCRHRTTTCLTYLCWTCHQTVSFACQL